MEVGMLTTPFLDKTLEEVMDFAESTSVACLEIPAHPGSKHVDAAKLNRQRAREIQQGLDERLLRISALAFYTCDLTNPKKCAAVRRVWLTPTIDARGRPSMAATSLASRQLVCAVAAPSCEDSHASVLR